MAVRISPLQATQISEFYVRTIDNKYNNTPVFRSLTDLIREKAPVTVGINLLRVVLSDILKILIAEKIGSPWVRRDPASKSDWFTFSSQEEVKSYITDEMMVKFSGNALKEVVDTLADDLNKWWEPRHEIIMEAIGAESKTDDRAWWESPQSTTKPSPHLLLDILNSRQKELEKILTNPDQN